MDDTTTIDARYTVHMPRRAVEAVEEAREDGCDVSIRMSSGTVLVKIDGEPERYYRGYEIQFRDDAVYDRWVVGGLSTSPRFQSLRDAKHYVDGRIAARGVV